MGELFYKACPVKINVRITIVPSPFQVFVFMGATLTNIYNFKLRPLRFVEYEIKYSIKYI